MKAQDGRGASNSVGSKENLGQALPGRAGPLVGLSANSNGGRPLNEGVLTNEEMTQSICEPTMEANIRKHLRNHVWEALAALALVLTLGLLSPWSSGAMAAESEGYPGEHDQLVVDNWCRSHVPEIFADLYWTHVEPNGAIGTL